MLTSKKIDCAATFAKVPLQSDLLRKISRHVPEGELEKLRCLEEHKPARSHDLFSV